jgi:hypothetical protein
MHAFGQTASGTVNISVSAEYGGQAAFSLLHEDCDNQEHVNDNQDKS